MADLAEHTGASLYEADEHEWIAQQVRALQAENYAALDRDSLIEFLTAMALRDERELESRLIILFSHMLKMQYQPERISRGWRLAISEQQRAINRLLKKLPSLRARAEDVFLDIIPDALALAMEETGTTFHHDGHSLSLGV